MKIFLKINSVFLFVLICGPFYFIRKDSINQVLLEANLWLPVSIILFEFGFLILVLWIFSIGILSKRKNLLNQLWTRIFNISFLASIISYTCFTYQKLTGDSRPLVLIFSGLGIFAAYFFLLLMIIYASKTIRTLELSKSAKFVEYWHYVIVFFCFVIGIWVMQPRIKKLTKE